MNQQTPEEQAAALELQRQQEAAAMEADQAAKTKVAQQTAAVEAKAKAAAEAEAARVAAQEAAEGPGAQRLTEPGYAPQDPVDYVPTGSVAQQVLAHRRTAASTLKTLRMEYKLTESKLQKIAQRIQDTEKLAAHEAAQAAAAAG